MLRFEQKSEVERLSKVLRWYLTSNNGETLVINNLVYQIPCWAGMDDLYLEKLDLTILPIIPFE